MSKDYKEAGEIVKSYDDLYGSLPKNAQIRAYTDYRTCQERMECLEQYLEAVRKEKALREVHHKRFFLEIDEGHLKWLEILNRKISRIERCLATFKTHARDLSFADHAARLISQNFRAFTTDLEAQWDTTGVPESDLQAPSGYRPTIHTNTSSVSASRSIPTSTVSPASTRTNSNPPVYTNTSTSTFSQTVIPGAWPKLTAPTSASASSSRSIPTSTSSTVSRASMSTTRAYPHDQTPLLSQSQLNYASAARDGGSGQGRGHPVVRAVTTTPSSSSVVPSTPTSTSRTSQPVQSSNQYSYSWYSPYPEYNRDDSRRVNPTSPNLNPSPYSQVPNPERKPNRNRVYIVPESPPLSRPGPGPSPSNSNPDQDTPVPAIIFIIFVLFLISKLFGRS